MQYVIAWWSEDFKGSSQTIGDEFSVTFGNLHYSKHKVLDFLPFKRIVWLVTDSKLSFLKNQKEWTGTRNIFEISTENGKTKLTFTHVGLLPNIECYGDCSKGWNYYLQESLLPFILTGKGKPNEVKSWSMVWIHRSITNYQWTKCLKRRHRHSRPSR